MWCFYGFCTNLAIKKFVQLNFNSNRLQFMSLSVFVQAVDVNQLRNGNLFPLLRHKTNFLFSSRCTNEIQWIIFNIHQLNDCEIISFCFAADNLFIKAFIDCADFVLTIERQEQWIQHFGPLAISNSSSCRYQTQIAFTYGWLSLRVG